VAGLHTRGKNYVARASNIEKYTEGRFNPNGQLARDPLPLEDEENPPRSPLPVPAPIDRSAPSLLVLHEDQLSLAHLPLGDWNLKGVLIADLLERRSPAAIGEPVRAHVTGLIDINPIIDYSPCHLLRRKRQRAFLSSKSGRMVSQMARKSNALRSAFAGTRHRPPEESGRTAQRVRFASRSNTKTPHSRYGERREDRQVRVKLFDQQEH
jgi:hypothetical protein